MTQSFKVGEIAIAQNLIFSSHLNGTEVEVVEGLELRKWHAVDSNAEGTDLTYKVRWPNGQITSQLPRELRKKRPPQQYTGELRIRELFDVAPVKQLVPELA